MNKRREDIINCYQSADDLFKIRNQIRTLSDDRSNYEPIQELRIIVAGGRDFDDYILLCNSLTEYLDRLHPKEQITIVSGGARGADTLGEEFAKRHGFNLKRFPANWGKYGKSAGPIRNRDMAEFAAKTDGVLFAFWDGNSRGTANMITLAEKYGLDVHIVNYEKEK